jgi:hypothetical protein
MAEILHSLKRGEPGSEVWEDQLILMRTTFGRIFTAAFSFELNLKSGFSMEFTGQKSSTTFRMGGEERWEMTNSTFP